MADVSPDALLNVSALVFLLLLLVIITVLVIFMGPSFLEGGPVMY